MAYNFTPFKSASTETLEWLKREYAGIRTGRATPAILDTVEVEVYNSRVPISQLASVSVEGPISLRITPWDKGVVSAIDRAIRESNLGLSVAVDEQGIRVSFPTLTSERRAGLQKLAKDKLEEARVRIRNEREKVLKDIDKNESLSKDDKFRIKSDLQKMVDDTNKTLEDLSEKKNKEISE